MWIILPSSQALFSWEKSSLKYFKMSSAAAETGIYKYKCQMLVLPAAELMFNQWMWVLCQLFLIKK